MVDALRQQRRPRASASKVAAKRATAPSPVTPSHDAWSSIVVTCRSVRSGRRGRCQASHGGDVRRVSDLPVGGVAERARAPVASARPRRYRGAVRTRSSTSDPHWSARARLCQLSNSVVGSSTSLRSSRAERRAARPAWRARDEGRATAEPDVEQVGDARGRRGSTGRRRVAAAARAGGRSARPARPSGVPTRTPSRPRPSSTMRGWRDRASGSSGGIVDGRRYVVGRRLGSVAAIAAHGVEGRQPTGRPRESEVDEPGDRVAVTDPSVGVRRSDSVVDVERRVQSPAAGWRPRARRRSAGRGPRHRVPGRRARSDLAEAGRLQGTQGRGGRAAAATSAASSRSRSIWVSVRGTAAGCCITLHRSPTATLVPARMARGPACMAG